ncbi:MAG: hypothetical protein U0869_24360 [Chloroflexota bacterium]
MRPVLLASGVVLLAAAAGLAVGAPNLLGHAPTTASAPAHLPVPLALDRPAPRDSFWTVTAAGGMAYQRDDAWDLALSDVAQDVVRRSERPDTDAVIEATGGFVAGWEGWFGADGTTNATLSVAPADGSGGAPRTVVLEVSQPSLDGGTLRMRARVIEPEIDSQSLSGTPDSSLPTTFGMAVLTLDGETDFTRSIGPVQVTGMPKADNSIDVKVAMAGTVLASGHLTPVFPELPLSVDAPGASLHGTLLARYADGRTDVSLEATPLIWAGNGDPSTEYRGVLGAW